MKKNFYIDWGFLCSRRECEVCVICTAEELDVVATAIAHGENADWLVAYDKPGHTRFDQPYKVYRDCM